jgi:DNA-binding response OmpR family regulator
MRILIVEDNDKLADGLKHLLTDQGFAVDLVSDGESALSAALTLNYDLVILDLSVRILTAWKCWKESDPHLVRYPFSF